MQYAVTVRQYNLHKYVHTCHVVEPDVPADGMEGVVLPAHAHVPQPGLVVEDPQAVGENDAVEEEPPALLAELGEGGGYTCTPLLTEPSLHLEKIAYVHKNRWQNKII